MADKNNISKIFTKKECVTVLENHLRYSISEIEIISFDLVPTTNEILGLLGDYFHLEIIAEVGPRKIRKTVQYFVKSFPIGSDMEKVLIEQFNFFPKESGMYTTLLRDLDKYSSVKWHPDCYYARKDIIVMEDLRTLNFRHIAQDETFSLNHLKLTLSRFAVMHASSIILEEKTGVNIGEKYAEFLQEASILPDCGWLNAGLNAIQGVARTMHQFQTKEYQNFISNDFGKFKDRMIEIVETSDKFRNTFCHRDPWIRNILYKYDSKDSNIPSDSAFVDFQMSRYHPPAIDVIQFIYLNTSRETHDGRMEEFLNYYYNCLKLELQKAFINIENIFSLEKFFESCEYVKLFPLVLNGIYSQLSYLPPGYVYDLKRSNLNFYNYCMTIDRTDFVLNQMAKDETYKGRMLECINEIIQFGCQTFEQK